MKRLQPTTFAACLAPLVASSVSGVALTAENVVATQELQIALASDQVRFVRWTRQADAYVLVVGLGQSAEPARSGGTTADPTAATNAEAPAQARSAFFIGNTIANLRGLDPAFCGRTLTLIDGRRTLSGQSQTVRAPREPGPANQPYAAAVKDPRAEVWLLKTDGALILPAAYSCNPGPASVPPSDRVNEISYTYPAAEAAQAVAAAIRVHDDFFIEKLQSLQPPSIAQ